MKKEQWISLRNKEELPTFVYYEYYKEVGGLVETLEEFEKILFLLVVHGVPVRGTNGPKMITFESIIQKTHKHFNKKFDLVWS